MANVTIQRIPFSQDTDNRMRTLKGRTQITPNLLCRLGFAMSLEEAGNPPPIQLEGDEVGRDINRNTLLGEYEPIFITLLTQWMDEHGLDSEDEVLANQSFTDHMNRGAEMICSRLKGVGDLYSLLPKRSESSE
jgi:DNA sulfur modification protein DndE